MVLRKPALDPLIDAIFSHAQAQIQALQQFGPFADIDLTCRAIERFHKLMRAVTGYVEIGRLSRWATVAGGLTTTVSALIEPRLRDVAPDVNRALRRRDGTDRLDSDLLLSALNGCYVLAAVRECRDSLALNALFDQTLPGTDAGTLLEVLVGRDGVHAWRTAPVSTYLRMGLDAWSLPEGDAVSVDGEWWNAAMALPQVSSAPEADAVDGLRDDALIVEARDGDVDRDGVADIVVAYRRPWEPRLLQRIVDPDGGGSALADATGRSAHFAWFSGGRIRWGAGTLPRPIATFDVCDDGIAVGITTLDQLTLPDATVVAGGAWWWRDFGFSTAPLLDGRAVPVCADPDGDGMTTPALRRVTDLDPQAPEGAVP